MKNVAQLKNSSYYCKSHQKERMIPMYRRKQVAKMEKEAPQEFQLIPSSGHLLPGQRKNVQVKFMPLEEVRSPFIL